MANLIGISDVISAMKTLRGPISFDVIMAYMTMKHPEIAGKAHVLVHYALRDAVRAGLIKKAPGGMYSYIPTTENVSLGDNVNTSKTAQVAPDDKIDPPLVSKRRKGECKEAGRKRQKKKMESPEDSAGTKDPPTTLNLSFTSIHNHFNCSDTQNTAENETTHKEGTFSAEEESLAGPSGTSTEDLERTPKKNVNRKNKRYPAGKQSLTGLPRTVKNDISKLPKKRAIRTKKQTAAGQISLISLSGKSSDDLKKDVECNLNDAPAEKESLTGKLGENLKIIQKKEGDPKQHYSPAGNDILTVVADVSSDDCKTTQKKDVVCKETKPPAAKDTSAGPPTTANDDCKNVPKKEVVRRKKRCLARKQSLTALPATPSGVCTKTTKKEVLQNNKTSPAKNASLTEVVGMLNDDSNIHTKNEVDRKESKDHAFDVKDSLTQLHGTSTKIIKDSLKELPCIYQLSLAGRKAVTGKEFLDESFDKTYEDVTKEEGSRKKNPPLDAKESLTGLPGTESNDCINRTKKEILQTNQIAPAKNDSLTGLVDTSSDYCDNYDKNELDPKKRRSSDRKDLVTEFPESAAGSVVPAGYNFKSCLKNKAVRKTKRCPAVKGSLTELVPLSSSNVCVVCKERYVRNPSKEKTGEGDVLPAQKRKTRKAGKNGKVKANKKNSKTQSVSKSSTTKVRVYFKI